MPEESACFLRMRKPCSGIHNEVLVHTELVRSSDEKPTQVAKKELRKIPDWMLNCEVPEFICFNGVPAVIKPANERGPIIIEPNYDAKIMRSN